MLIMLKEGGSLAIDSPPPPVGDVSLTDVLTFVLYNGSADNIVVASNSLKFLEYNGTQDDISTIGNTLNFKMYDGTVDNIKIK